MISNLDVMKQLLSYLQGEQNAEALRHWMVGVQLESKKNVEPVADLLISEMDGVFAQMSDGIIPESSVRKEFAKLLLSDGTQTQATHVQYSFLRPSFVNPLPAKINSSETSSTETTLSDRPHVTQELALA